MIYEKLKHPGRIRRTLEFCIIFMILFLMTNCFMRNDTSNRNKILGLFLLDQLGGNCITINKNTTGTTYTASASQIPKYRCNSAYLQNGLYTTSITTAKKEVDAYYDLAKAEYDKYSSCSTLSESMTSLKSQISETYLQNVQNLLLSGNKGCFSSLFRISDGRVSPLNLCKDETSITAIKALSLTYLVGDASKDMDAKLNDLKKATTNGITLNGFNSFAIQSMRPYNLTEYEVINSPAYYFWLGSLGNKECATSIASNNPSIKSVISALYGKLGFGVSETEAKAVNSVITDSLSCGYGTGFSEISTSTSNTVSSVQQRCPSGYPLF